MKNIIYKLIIGILICGIIGIVFIMIYYPNGLRDTMEVNLKIECEDNHLMFNDVLTNVDCRDVLYNSGDGLVYGTNTLIQQLCLYQEIDRMYKEIEGGQK